jgi:hypothetical protein
MRSLVRAILSVILLLAPASISFAQMLETGIDRPGGDYSSSSGTPSPGQCQNLCQNDGACRAWTWVKPGVQGSKSVCYLKNVIPQQEPNSCCTSGVKLAGPIPPNAAAGMDRFGSDYSSISLSSPKPKACADACAGDAACKAWTYVNPGIKGPQAVCFLKNAVPPETSDSCCVSGVKSLPPPAVLPPGAAAGKDRPGSDFASSVLPAANPQLCYDQCQANNACKAWTYVKPGVQGPKAICYLKNAVPNAVNDSCCISGVKASPPPPAVLPPGAAAGKDRPGSDFASSNLPVPNPQLCYDQCQANSACKAWTYVKPGVQGPKAICYLKKAVPNAVNDSCCISGVKASLPPPAPLPPGAAAGKDRPGSDFASSNLPVPNPQLCYDQCQANSACKAWTYVKPGVQGPKAICYLKKAVPNAVNDSCCISGVKAAPAPGKIEKNTDRPGGDYVEFPLGGKNTDVFCMAACALQGNCKAWTFVKPGYQGSKARCWLKSKVPPPVYDDCCTSGVK